MAPYDMPTSTDHSAPASGRQGTGAQPGLAAAGPSVRPGKASTLRAKFPSACTECRRRKQKCDLGNPCTSCSRRFPQPICEYSTSKIKSKKYSSPPKETSQADSDIRGLYSHLDFERVGDVINQLEESLAWDNGVAEDIHRFASSLPARYRTGSSSPSDWLIKHRNAPELNWRAYADDFSPPESWILYEELCRLGPRGKRDLIGGSYGKKFLDFLMTYRFHAIDNFVQNDWPATSDEWMGTLKGTSSISTEIGSLDHELRHLPMAPTKINKELLRTHLQVLSRFKASIDGYPRHDSPFMRRWVSHGLQDPLMLQTDIYSAACFLNEAGRLPKSIVLACQNVLHQTLNEYLASPEGQVSDSAILGVFQLVTNTWLWGETEDLRIHMKGLKTMLTLRGGLQNLGMEGITSKSIIVQDAAIALAHGIEPCLIGRPGFEFDDPFMVPFQVAFNCPLTFECPPFAIPSATSKLHPTTAKILDDVRSLFQTVLSLPEFPTWDQLRGVEAAAAQTVQIISELPEELSLPDGQDVKEGSKSMPDQYAKVSVKAEQTDNVVDLPSVDDIKSSESINAKRQDDAALTAKSLEVARKSAREVKRTKNMYKCVRTAALVYCRAIQYRKPTSEILGEAEFTQLWWTTWYVSLDRWKSAAGIYVWIMLTMAPSCHGTAFARFTKSSLYISTMAIAMENWHTTVDLVTVALKLQRWLRGENPSAEYGEQGEGETDAFAGGKAIERHGYAMRLGRRRDMEEIFD